MLKIYDHYVAHRVGCSIKVIFLLSVLGVALRHAYKTIQVNLNLIHLIEHVKLFNSNLFFFFFFFEKRNMSFSFIHKKVASESSYK
jgi:hypothetical protein